MFALGKQAIPKLLPPKKSWNIIFQGYLNRALTGTDMDSISHYLSEDHGHCDDIFASAENAVDQADWALAAQQFVAFHDAMLLHFAREENTLFPAFEADTGMANGPTVVMRQEHIQMRDAMQAMAEAVAARDAEEYLGLSETLLMLMRQHNMKEEQILYRMCDQVLAAQTDTLVQRMRTQATPAKP